MFDLLCLVIFIRPRQKLDRTETLYFDWLIIWAVTGGANGGPTCSTHVPLAQVGRGDVLLMYAYPLRGGRSPPLSLCNSRFAHC